MREPVIPQLDAEEYLHWENRQPERFELQNGFVVSFAGGTRNHDRISFNLRTALERSFEAPCETFGSDIKIRVSATIVYYADAGVICTPTTEDATVVTSPTVVCEVLSEGTRTYDLVDKRVAYRQLSSLNALIIVHTRMRRIEVDTRNGQGTWQTVVIEDGVLPIGSTPISIDQIYERTSIGIDDRS